GWNFQGSKYYWGVFETGGSTSGTLPAVMEFVGSPDPPNGAQCGFCTPNVNSMVADLYYPATVTKLLDTGGFFGSVGRFLGTTFAPVSAFLAPVLSPIAGFLGGIEGALISGLTLAGQ